MRSIILFVAALAIVALAGATPSRSEPTTVARVAADGSRATYTDPTIIAVNGETVLLDHCREWSINCGQPAAEVYCKRNGYPFVKTFSLAKGAGQTGVIATGAICSGELCTGFREISCSRSDVLEQAPSQGPSPFGAGDTRAAVDAKRPDSHSTLSVQAGIASDSRAAPTQSSRCKPGYVWRVARPQDLVCVTLDASALAAAENADARNHIDLDGAYGANSCVAGYVWRNAFDGDVVCVTPGARDRVALENIASQMEKAKAEANDAEQRSKAVMDDTYAFLSEMKGGVPRDSFIGVWATVTAAGNLYTMTLKQNGDTVTGTYKSNVGGITGKIEGKIERGPVAGVLSEKVSRGVVRGPLVYRWTEGNASGSGKFTLGPGGNSFEGWWNSVDDPDAVEGSWNGTRK